MADPGYLIVFSPAPAVDVWPIGVDTDLYGGYVDAAKATLGCPDDWIDVPGWDISITFGLPHPSLLARATVHDGPPT